MAEFRVPSPKELQELRKKVGLTQAELANSVGISQSLVARIEKGQVNPSINTLKRILEVIEKQQQVHSSVGDLIKWKGQSSKLNPLIWVGIATEWMLIFSLISFAPFEKIFSTAPLEIWQIGLLLICPPLLLGLEEIRKLIIKNS